MTGTVFAVASGKGGVGKTTTAINLGAMLAAADHEVIVVDTDLGMANVGGYLDFEVDGATLHEVLSGDADVEDAVYHAPGDIDVLPSSTDIYTFAQSQTAQLQRVVADLTEDYEYVLLDTGAGISYDTILPLSLADEVLLVTTPDVAAVRDTAKTAELTDRVEGTVGGAVLTQRGNDILNADNVEGTLDAEVLTVVPDDETVPMGIDAGRPLAAFSPNSPAATAYRELANILTGETETPELSGEPSTAEAAVPSLADAEFELGTAPDEEPSAAASNPGPETSSEEADEATPWNADSSKSDPAKPDPPSAESDPTAESDSDATPASHATSTSPVAPVSNDDPDTDFEPPVEPDLKAAELGMDVSTDERESSSSDSGPAADSDSRSDSRPEPAASESASESTASDSTLEPEPESTPSDSGPEPTESSSETSAPETDPVHDLIDRRVIKTGDDPLEPANGENGPAADDATPADPGAADATTEDSTTADSTTTDRDGSNEFDTVLSDHDETRAETTSKDAAQSSPDLPDEIVEAEPNDDDEVEAVPFQGEPVRPDLNDDVDEDEGNEDEDADKETNGLFGRIGSLFR
ncbi:cell division ATPase MinD [Haladaptatus paucihalophilus]|uniref:Septum site-determining protein MinD n=1 Tax=Haladaptatus paucihalophilus DX253 TaxID=797209 RepID=A0A1M7ASP4_HALPU|nr:cell division ATPase MinD [Haladaptatus paucihalophilus]SHL45778.1 septum site-determining protein MinD [Haladaptatus paucihalophilus DX253]